MTYAFAMQPSVPDIAQARAAALALLSQSHADDTAPAELAADDAGDYALRPGDTVRVLSSNPCYPEYVRVEKLLTNGEVCVSNLRFGGIRRREPVDNLVIHIVWKAD